MYFRRRSFGCFGQCSIHRPIFGKWIDSNLNSITSTITIERQLPYYDQRNEVRCKIWHIFTVQVRAVDSSAMKYNYLSPTPIDESQKYTLGR